MGEAFFRGNVGDAMTRSWIADPSSDLASHVVQAIETVASESKSIKWLTKTKKLSIVNDMSFMADGLETILRNKILPYKYEVPKKFSVPLPMDEVLINLVGEMDFLILNDDGNYGIYDLKITSSEQYWRSTLSQLTFYDLACSLMFGTKNIAAGLIQPLCSHQVIELEISDQDRRELLSQIISMACA